MSAIAQYGSRTSGHQRSVCATHTPESQCAPGLEFARGALIGEHSWITRQAMFIAGLSDLADASVELDYFTDEMKLLGVYPADPKRP